jgi:hypothetical protein
VIGRRELFGSAIAGVALITASEARACIIVPTPKAKPFRSSQCERQIYEIVDFMNLAPGLSMSEIEKWVDDRDIDVAYEYPVSQNVGGVLYNYMFFKEYKMSGGKLDAKPIRVAEINLVRQTKNQAAFQFTLEREQFFPADDEGCDGLFTHDEYVGKTQTAFIARFLNNKLESFREFEEWFA